MFTILLLKTDALTFQPRRLKIKLSLGLSLGLSFYELAYPIPHRLLTPLTVVELFYAQVELNHLLAVFLLQLLLAHLCHRSWRRIGAGRGCWRLGGTLNINTIASNTYQLTSLSPIFLPPPPLDPTGSEPFMFGPRSVDSNERGGREGLPQAGLIHSLGRIIWLQIECQAGEFIQMFQAKRVQGHTKVKDWLCFVIDRSLLDSLL